MSVRQPSLWSVSLGIELACDGLPFHHGRVGEVFDVSVKHGDRGAQAVAVFEDEHCRVGTVVGHASIGFPIDCITGGLGQIHRPQPDFSRLPGRIAFQAGHRGDSGFPAQSPFDHALQHFEGVGSVNIEPGEPDRDRFFNR